MRFHCLGLPHTITSPEYSACAFTQKVLKFCTMMSRRGHTVYHYGHEKSQVKATEHVTVTNDAVLEKAYGSYDWHTEQFKHSSDDYAHTVFNMNAAEEITKRKKPGDFLLLFWGSGHAHVAKVHANDMILVEPGIGSFNALTAPFCVFESYAVMHYVYGKHNIGPRFMDAVVPNYFDEDDFNDTQSLNDSEAVGLLKQLHAIKSGYVVVIARLISSKGIQLAVETCKHLKLRLYIAGQGNIKKCLDESLHDFVYDSIEALEAAHWLATNAENSRAESSSAAESSFTGGVVHIGYICPKERHVLLSKAKCIMCPTLYVEPFGGVNVEAQFCGIPVVSSDWGAFAETVIHGTTGYRCRTFDHFVWALKNVDHLNREKIKEIARANYGLQKVATMYEEYFSMLQSVFTKQGFYEPNPARMSLKWLEKKI